MQHTRQPWELIVVDNGSTDETAVYLAGVQDAAVVPVTVVTNATNRGFPAAINQGLQVAHGEYLVLLNNDVVVTDGWLQQLIGLATMAITTESGGTVSRKSGTTENNEETNRRVFTTEGTEGTEVMEKGGQFREVKDAYPGRNITVIDLAAGDPDPASSEPRIWNGNSGTENPKSKIENPKSVIGLVGPMSNYAAPPQLVENVTYRDMAEMHDFARRWRDDHRGQWFNVHKLSGFCLLVKRAVYDKIGGLDERFGIGFFDDDDLAERARRAGFELAVAHDLFVHHFGSQTFTGNGVDAQKLLDENAQRFAAKWGLTETIGQQVALRPFVDRKFHATDFSGRKRALESRLQAAAELKISPQGGTPTERGTDKVSVSLTVIARDEEENLPKCLESVRGIFDEIVVVDTGSTDRTIEIAREFGARVFNFAWVDDFAAARNEALAHATGDYAFWLDADDVVEAPERVKLEALFHRLRGGDEACYVVRCACDPSPDGTGGETVVDHIRLFPICPDVRWSYRVHEQILPALKRAGIPVRWTKLVVRHTGYADKALRSRKLDRDTKILMRELEERPDEPFVLFNLGSVAVEREDWHEALGYLRRSLSGSAPTDSIVRKLYALIARVHQATGETHDALCACALGLKLDPEDAELWFRKGVVHRYRGESADAENCWRRILSLERPEQFCSFDQGIYGHLTRRNLAMLAAERGDFAESKKLWLEVLAECPGDREALAKLRRLTQSAPIAIETQNGSGTSPWIVPGSRRKMVPSIGQGDFDPYAPLAENWVRELNAKVVVELGVRFGASTRAMLAGARAVDGHVWGVDPLKRHDVCDDRFTFIQADPMEVAGRWERVDFLHVDVDPHREDDARRWLTAYAGRCRAIAVHDTHHPGFRLGPVVAELAATDRWQVFEYRGNLAGWTVLVRPADSSPADLSGAASPKRDAP